MKVIENVHAFIWNNPSANNCNTYLINKEKKILIDPGHYHLFENVRDNLSRISLSPEDIDLVIITHCHPDHFEGLKVFMETSTLIAIHKTDMDFLNKTAPFFKETLGTENFEPHILLKEGEIKAGEMDFQIIHTPGHSPGSVCVYWPEKKVLFTGDVIFNQGVGRTDLHDGNGEDLKKSIKKLSTFDVEYLLPGHGEIISGKENVRKNFEIIERMWFAYL